jgi:hypothetical protein
MGKELTGAKQARKDIVAEIKPKGIHKDVPYKNGDDNYVVTSSYLFTKEQRRLNRQLGL